MISGSGAQTQSTTYLPGYYRVIDQNVGGTGSLWQVLSNGPTCKIGRVYNVFPEPSGSDPFLAYNKEILRQTMLKHEAIFRNQVHELHRLYGRQRELMNEVSRNHLKMQTSQSTLIPSQMENNISQMALQIPSTLLDGKAPAQGGENIQMPSTRASQKSTKAGSMIYLKENGLEEQGAASSKSHYSRKRVLDLELPAEEYIDSEDEEGLEDRNYVQFPQVQSDPSKSASRSPTKSNLKLDEACSSNGSSNYSKTTFLFDLNEPLKLDESETPISAIDSSTEIVPPQDQDSFGKLKSGSPVRHEESTYNVLEGKGIDGCLKFLHLKMEGPLKLLPCSSEAGNEGSSLISDLQDASAGVSPILCGDRTSLGSEVAKKDSEIFDDNNHQSMLSSCITNSCSPVLISNEAKNEASTLVSSQKTSLHNFREIIFAIQALPCFNNPELLSKTSRSSTSNSGIKKKHCNSKRNPAHSPCLGSESCCITGNNDNRHAAEPSYPSECITDSNHAKSFEDMDLDVMPHSCLPGSVVSQEKHRRADGANSSKNCEGQFNRPRVKPDYDGANLEAPVSPDNKEHPPPRGESEENQVVMSSYISEQKTRDPNEDIDRIAAEAIVSISSLAVQQYLRNDESGPLEVSIDCLSWFAGIVSSVTGDSEIEFERHLNDASSSDHNVNATGESEHIEATVVKLTGIKVEDQFPETSNQKSKTVAGMMLPRHQEGKGGARKMRQRKGFLSGLPCIASLSFSVVNKNLQPTEQLIKAAGSTSGSITGRRNVGGNGRARRCRNSKMVSSRGMERKVCSLLKQHTFENELSFTLGSSLVWGRKHRRQKSRQARAKCCLHFV